VKALLLRAYNDLAYLDVPEPVLQLDEVLVRVRACGICGSDVHGVDGSTGRRIPPIIMGHEAAGDIVVVGPAVHNWQVGDRVTFGCVVHCGDCFHCRRGEPELCDRRRWLGVSIPDQRMHGAFAELVAVPQQILYCLPAGLAYEQAALLEPLTIAAHALARTPVNLYDSALVVGAGMIGLVVVQLLRLAGCGQIIAVDVNPARLALARRLGATATLRSDEGDIAAQVKARTGGRGADVAFEAVGIEQTIALTIQGLRKGGSLTLIGNLAPTVSVPLQTIVIQELTLRGTTNAAYEWDACIGMLASGAVDVTPLISVVAPLTEGAHWFARLRSPDAGLFKVLLQP
jgi:L-iditol 2-dehydrogenase